MSEIKTTKDFMNLVESSNVEGNHIVLIDKVTAETSSLGFSLKDVEILNENIIFINHYKNEFKEPSSCNVGRLLANNFMLIGDSFKNPEFRREILIKRRDILKEKLEEIETDLKDLLN